MLNLLIIVPTVIIFILEMSVYIFFSFDLSGKYHSYSFSFFLTIGPGTYEIRSDVEMKLTELVDFLKDITKSKSKIILFTSGSEG